MPANHTHSDDTIRTGSPFAAGTMVQAVGEDVQSPNANTNDSNQGRSIASEAAGESLTDGVMNYTAQGSAIASLMVVFFASAAAWWFPAGGVVIAGLGCGLAVGGLFSDYRLPSAGLLLIHLGLFFFSYSMAL